MKCRKCDSTRVKKSSTFTYYCIICKEVWGIFDREFIGDNKKK